MQPVEGLQQKNLHKNPCRQYQATRQCHFIGQGMALQQEKKPGQAGAANYGCKDQPRDKKAGKRCIVEQRKRKVQQAAIGVSHEEHSAGNGSEHNTRQQQEKKQAHSRLVCIAEGSSLLLRQQ